MNFLRFLLSKTFYKQLLYLGLGLPILFWIISFSLKLVTHQQEYLEVPDLEGISIAELPDLMGQESVNDEVGGEYIKIFNLLHN